ncbi:MAG: hypothetical protein BWY73_01047 [candidate division TA06 bacterium ADurb.Bin417]|uniref:Uncharacterized protein n=1 Tax=candidate division TA06 bacterium ADurb.Bin417 TaxID=1852828 RepID=A0A1V5MER2_UNCT6|nr:MAG: hypothetical protein BWY73_01047 [candidate division TA06 bacterium ADurb.Bin417]
MFQPGDQLRFQAAPVDLEFEVPGPEVPFQQVPGYRLAASDRVPETAQGQGGLGLPAEVAEGHGLDLLGGQRPFPADPFQGLEQLDPGDVEDLQDAPDPVIPSVDDPAGIREMLDFARQEGQVGPAFLEDGLQALERFRFDDLVAGHQQYVVSVVKGGQEFGRHPGGVAGSGGSGLVAEEMDARGAGGRRHNLFGPVSDHQQVGLDTALLVGFDGPDDRRPPLDRETDLVQVGRLHPGALAGGQDDRDGPGLLRLARFHLQL